MIYPQVMIEGKTVKHMQPDNYKRNHQQSVKYGQKHFIENNTLMEIEAQDQLLRIGKKERWSK